MVGASSDRSRADYELLQLLGLIDASHRVYSDPAAIDPIYRAAQEPIVGNRFDGTERTDSAYFNETWSPLSNLHLTVAARYNDTDVKSHLFTRAAEGTVRLDQIRNRNVISPVRVDLSDGESGVVSRGAGAGGVRLQRQCRATRRSRRTSSPTSRSTRRSACNWLPIPTLNLFANASRGARVPSVVELGCAFDPTPVPVTVGSEDNPIVVGTRARSLAGSDVQSADDAVGRSVPAADSVDVG